MNYYRIISIVLFLSLLFFLYKIIDWRFFLEKTLNVNFNFFILGVFFSILWPMINARRWQILLNELSHKTLFLDCLKISLVSFSANLFAPIKSGDLLKIFLHNNVKEKSNLVSAIVSDRICDLVALSFLCLLGGIYIRKNLIVIIGLSILIFLIIITIVNSYKKFAFKLKKITKIYSIFNESFSFIANLSINFFSVLFLSLLNWLLASIQIWLFYLSFNVDITIFTVMSLFPMVVVLTLIPITPSGLGIREVSFLYLFLEYSDIQTNLAVSISYFLSNSVLPALVGLKYLNDFLIKLDINSNKKFKKMINLRNLF